MLLMKGNWRGGLPLENDELLKKISKIDYISIPKIAQVPVYFEGENGNIEIKIGDLVREGDLIGKREGISVHSPVPGEVIDISYVESLGGLDAKTVSIKTEGEFDILGKKKNFFPWKGLNKDTLCYMIQDKGVIDFLDKDRRIERKLAKAKNTVVEHLVINGVESEPMIYNYHFLLKEYPLEIAKGIEILSYILNYPKNVTLVMDGSKFELISEIKKAFAKEKLKCNIRVLKNKYPQSNSKIIYKYFSGVDLDSEKSVLDKGFFVIDVYTLFAIYEAIELQKPIIEKIITINGDCITRPFIAKVRIGTTLSSVVNSIGGLTKKVKKIVVGGPFKGKAIRNIDMPLDKYVNSVLFLSKNLVKDETETECIDCKECVRICPVSINPVKIYNLIKNNMKKELINEGVNLCISCGLCSYACPSYILLREEIEKYRTAN